MRPYLKTSAGFAKRNLAGAGVNRAPPGRSAIVALLSYEER
jgi:hypothetical protein